jgi:hypothetical protein
LETSQRFALMQSCRILTLAIIVVVAMSAHADEPGTSYFPPPESAGGVKSWRMRMIFGGLAGWILQSCES